jgi:hypothetical protein
MPHHRGEGKVAMSTVFVEPTAQRGTPLSAASWGAILAGGAAAAALSLVMLILGTGLGLAAVSPWHFDGASAKALGLSTIIWITFTQLLASAVGGYLAGRLRAKWPDAARDEVYFRDTAHGFLAWCVASLGTAAVLTTVVGSIVSGGVQAGATVAGQAAAGAGLAGSSVLAGAAANPQSRAMAGSAGSTGASGETSGSSGDPLAYFIDTLFRSNGTPSSSDSGSPDSASRSGSPAAGGSGAERTATSTVEVTRIFANALRTGSLSDDDARYVGRLIAQHSDLSASEAEQRVRDTFARVQSTLREAADTARRAADDARKASAYASLWLVVSLLVGAFVASLMATFGGRQRDL